jgi:hypothetical protein
MASLPNNTFLSSDDPLSGSEIWSTESSTDLMGLISTAGSGVTETKSGLQLGPDPIQKKATDRKLLSIPTTVNKRAAKHGLAPTGMAVPLQKKAFRVGGNDRMKCPLKESNLEKYHRIKAEQEGRKKKQNIRAANKLKKSGKVSTLAPFMF